MLIRGEIVQQRLRELVASRSASHEMVKVPLTERQTLAVDSNLNPQEEARRAKTAEYVSKS